MRIKDKILADFATYELEIMHKLYKVLVANHLASNLPIEEYDPMMTVATDVFLTALEEVYMSYDNVHSQEAVIVALDIASIRIGIQENI